MDITTKHFLKRDRIKADQEFDCMIYCLSKSVDGIDKEDYTKAASYMENALRSLKELQRLNLRKQQHEVNKRIVADFSKRNVKIFIIERGQV